MEKNVNTDSKNVVKAGVWYTISTVAVKAIAIISTPIFARILSKSDYGITTTFTSWYSLMLIICSLNVAYSVGRAKLDFPGKLREYMGSMQILSVVVTLVFFILSVIFIDPVSDLMAMGKPAVFILYIYLIGGSLVNLSQNSYRFEYKYKQNIAISVYTAISSVVFSLVFIYLFPNEKYIGRIIGIALPAFALGACFLLSGIIKGKARVNLEYWKYGLRFSVPLIIHTISLYVLSQSDKIFITKMCGTEDTAIYSLAYQYAILITLITNAINEAWIPWFHDTCYAKKYEEIRKNVKPIVMLSCIICVGCVAVSPEAIFILGGDQYAEGVWVVIPAAIGILAQCLFTHYVTIEVHHKKTIYISVGTLAAAALNILLNWIFIPQFGYIAAAYTTLFCYGVLFLVHFIITRFVMRVHLYNDKFMFLALFVSAVMCVGFALLYNMPIIRYFVLLLVCAVFLLVNKNYLSVFKKQFLKRG